MQEITLTPLDAVLLSRRQATIQASAFSKVVRGFTNLDVTVTKINDNDFIVHTVFGGDRDPIEEHTYQGTKEDRDAKLIEIQCPPSLKEWRTGKDPLGIRR